MVMHRTEQMPNGTDAAMRVSNPKAMQSVI